MMMKMERMISMMMMMQVLCTEELSFSLRYHVQSTLVEEMCNTLQSLTCRSPVWPVPRQHFLRVANRGSASGR